ncbi:hypothetical protein QE152_g3741 [Popillia japonica]|uniref:Uncharacterized protein n=1 Tax=Popillia japonica TaxID=7064 RepID=A0AAW1N2W5_POPJA
MEKNSKQNLNQDRETQDDGQAMDRENLERQLEEALVFGRRDSIVRTPPSQVRLTGQTSETPPRDALKGSIDRSIDSMWQDDDLLTSPTFKLIGETANTPLKAPQRRNSLPSPKELADLGGLKTESVSTEKHPSKRKRQESPSDVQSEIDDKRTVIEKFLGREQLKQTPLLDQCRWRNQRDT